MKQEHELLIRVAGLVKPEMAPAIASEMQTIPRNNPSIFNQIRRAESASARPELSEQRRKEYEQRINSILNPEHEVIG